MKFLAEFLYGGISKEILRGIAAVITCSTLFLPPLLGEWSSTLRATPDGFPGKIPDKHHEEYPPELLEKFLEELLAELLEQSVVEFKINY